jgi:hypothetical protein
MMMDERPMIDVCCVREQKVVSSYNGVSVLLARFRFDGALQRQFDVDDATSRSVAVSDSQTRHNAYRNQFPAIPPPPTNTNSFPISAIVTAQLARNGSLLAPARGTYAFGWIIIIIIIITSSYCLNQSIDAIIVLFCFAINAIRNDYNFRNHHRS